MVGLGLVLELVVFARLRCVASVLMVCLRLVAAIDLVGWVWCLSLRVALLIVLVSVMYTDVVCFELFSCYLWYDFFSVVFGLVAVCVGGAFVFGCCFLWLAGRGGFWRVLAVFVWVFLLCFMVVFA